MKSLRQTKLRIVTILGATGSIGTQGLEVIADNPDKFEVFGLACGSNIALLAQQIAVFKPKVVAIAKGSIAELKKLCSDNKVSEFPEILVGETAATELAKKPVDVVLNGMTGAVGLKPTLATLEAQNTLALANKESLIIGGELVKKLAKPGQIIPVDSEHSALAQCLMSTNVATIPYRKSEVAKLVLTASGGPFRGKTRSELQQVTPAEALAHPTWDMGRVVTTNSATLVNKGLEVIEAHLLFDVPIDAIDVVVHPQSIVHSMVEYIDGSTIAQCSPPDMKLPIALGLSWPLRTAKVATPCDWTKASQWTFEPLDEESFPAVKLAKHCAKIGGTAPAVYNAANEEAVDAFHEKQIAFLDIVDIVTEIVHSYKPAAELNLDTVLKADSWARKQANKLIKEKF
ncbi:MAG: 1-deoxy-D-xylulose-5-phosphate reductoisomerase [Micrococcaceae bacterium]